MPALRKFIEMPPPMVPAPMTATDLISRCCVSAGTSGILEAARSEKKMWRRARLSGLISSDANSSRSRASPSSNLFCVAASTASTHFAGAGRFLAMPLTMLRANWKYASPSGCLHGRSRTRGSGRASATERAKAIASSSSDSGDLAMRSNSFWPGNCASSSLLTGSPLTIMFSAVSTPSTRGRRCVPPAPGRMPSFTSGSAMLAPGAAMR